MSITRTLLASDLDGTLIPLERNAKRLREVAELVGAFETTPSLQLAYVTGRHLSLAQAGTAEVGLPCPDWFVCDVGTSVYHRYGGRYELDAIYRAEIKAAFGGLTGDQVRVAVGALRGVVLQEEEKHIVQVVQGRTTPPIAGPSAGRPLDGGGQQPRDFLAASNLVSHILFLS